MYYYYILTIRKSRVLEYSRHEELSWELLQLRLKYHFKVLDIGIHGNGKYFQLHSHIIVKKIKPLFIHQDRSDYFVHAKRIYDYKADKDRLFRYIHSDDYNNMYHLEQLLIENEYRNFYMGESNILGKLIMRK